MENGFTKNDGEKTNMAILFDLPLAIEEVAKVLNYGAKKYSRQNYEKVDDLERYESAPLRHQMSYHNGEKIDPESDLHHLAHSICSQLFLLEIELKKH